MKSIDIHNHRQTQRCHGNKAEKGGGQKIEKGSKGIPHVNLFIIKLSFGTFLFFFVAFKNL